MDHLATTADATDQDEEEILTSTVCDDALEAAAGTVRAVKETFGTVPVTYPNCC